MEWKLERAARRRVRTEEEILWEDVMRVLDKDMKQRRGQVSPKVFNVVNTTYSNFTSNLAKRLSAEAPVASSPITTRWRQSQAGDVTALSFGEEHSTADLPETVLKMTPEKETLTPGCRDGVRDGYFQRFSDTNYSILQPEVKIHLTGLPNDYYLNILDWNFQNLIAIALGSSVYVWNGDNHNRIENMYFSLPCKYVSSVSWMTEGTCLAVGTSEGEIQVLGSVSVSQRVLYSGGITKLWDVVTKKRLRNMLGHLSVVGALSWNHYILSSGSRLGRVYHHDVRVAQHHVGTLQHKQAVCGVKWAPGGRLLSSGCSDGLLTIWPYDPGANAQGPPVKVIHQSTAVKAIDWCPWQTEVLAVGGGMKDGCLHILDINTGQSIQTPSTDSQICSLTWLPKTKEIATGQGSPKNDVTVWTCPGLARSCGFFDHRGRVLHLALSPDQTRVFSAAADGTACIWNCC
ncbi:cell division cycle protein 20 homolog B isoform X1 [Bubalus kerabau]|uniref:cell division cycle protein 20 homolog B isoform X1 n=1 Tax=Bubalus carabanensis TaxID=3119969 RepID=UPI00244E9A5C|nr:cell division cycle protein 20 homolog B isoform X1 [Bubalus carabanensis]